MKIKLKCYFMTLIILIQKNKIYCKCNVSPSVKNIINYLNTNDFYLKPKIKHNSYYFDILTHQKIITPYLLNNLDYLNKKMNICKI